MNCTIAKCKADHLTDPVLKYIYELDSHVLVEQYADALAELLMSMEDDRRNDRRGAYLTRLRDCCECYFKGLWAGLLATPEEIIHDASGKPPYVMLVGLAKRVCTEVLESDNKLSQAFISEAKVQFKPMDVLNTSTHMSAYFLTHYNSMDDEDATKMYTGMNNTFAFAVQVLRYVSGMLRAAKPKDTIIAGVRSMSKKLPIKST